MSEKYFLWNNVSNLKLSETIISSGNVGYWSLYGLLKKEQLIRNVIYNYIYLICLINILIHHILIVHYHIEIMHDIVIQQSGNFYTAM